MAIFFSQGETKIRPGIYQRHTNSGFDAMATARDGICAIPVRASWGPLGKVVKNVNKGDLTKNYGPGTYGDDYTVPAAAAMFDGGAAIVYTYRLGTGGAKASKEITSGVTATAKYPGSMAISVEVKAKLGDATRKQFLVYVGTTLVETFDFSADATAEAANLINATKRSKYVEITGEATTIPALAVASGALTGGSEPTVTNDDYSNAFAALESYYFNTIALDKDDDEEMTLSNVLYEYLKDAYKMGKLCIAVVGEKSSVDFELRLEHAASFDDSKVVYLGGGYIAGNENKDGVMAICYTAGVIASCPSNKGITHAVIEGATDVCESLTYSQYEEAILNGMLLPSMSPEGAVWYDSGVNTLISPESGTQDEGWKKIRRVKVRFEMIDRLDRDLLTKVGRVSADSDGIADIIQTGQRILDAMVNEGKLFTGASFFADPSNPYEGDSAWFVIQADDIDSLEKIYLHYQFRYSQNS